MKKFFLVVAILALSVAIYFKFNSSKEHSTAKNLENTTEANNIASAEQSKKSLKVLSAEVKTTLDLSSDQTPQCRDFSQTMLTATLDQSINLLKEGKIGFSNDCIKNDPARLPGHLLKALYETCRPEKLNQNLQGCNQNLFIYSMAIKGVSFENQDLKSLSPGELSALFFRRMMTGQTTGLKAVTNELTHRMPDSAPANKAHVISFLVEMDPGESKSRTFSPELISQIQKARTLNPSDTELFEAELISHLGKPEVLQQKVDAFRQANPQSGLSDYYDASILGDKGDWAGARSALSAAIAKEPNNKRFSDTLSSLKNDPSKKAFTLQMGLDPNKL